MGTDGGIALGACAVVDGDAKTPEACGLVAGGGKIVEPVAIVITLALPPVPVL